MSLASVAGRVGFLTSTISQIEFEVSRVTQKRADIAYKAQSAVGLDQKLVEQLHYRDRELEMKMKKLETQLKVKQGEYDAVKKMLDTRAQKDFKYA